MNILVTGGAGFIGSNLCDSLIQDGHHVTVLDNLSTGKYEYVEELSHKRGFCFIRGDIMEKQLLDDTIKGKDAVFHLAANPGIRRSSQTTRLELSENTIGMWNILEAMRRRDVGSVIFSSSSAVYGEVNSDGPIKESIGSLLPVSLYGALKLAGEALISAYCHLYGFSGLIYRLANIVGSNQNYGVIVDFLTKLKDDPSVLEILGNGRQLRSYTDVTDCVRAMIHGLKIFPRNGLSEIYNLGTIDTITVDQVAQLLMHELRLDDVRLIHKGGVRGWPGDLPRCVLSIEKLKGTGWTPKFSSAQAVTRATRALRRAYFD